MEREFIGGCSEKTRNSVVTRTFVTFDADFADDAAWDDDSSCVVPGGEAIASAIGDALGAHAFPCSRVRQHSFYGWAFDVSVARSQFLCLIQHPGRWLVTCDRHSTVFRRWFGRGNDDDLAITVTTLHEVLRADRRFTNVQWFSREEYEQGAETGAPTP